MHAAFLRRHWITITAGCIALSVLSIWLHSAVLPGFSAGLVIAPGQAPKNFTLPLEFSSQPGEEAFASFSMQVGILHPTRFTLSADDCLQTLKINGKKVDDPQIPFCDYQKNRLLNLSGYLQPGGNRIEATIRNEGGPGKLAFDVSATDPLPLLLLLLGLSIPALYGWLFLRAFGASALLRSLYGTACFGIVLRILYLLVTPYTVRAHDVDGHLDYIRYVAEHLSLPPVGSSWEAWQPPLYYILNAPFAMMQTTLGPLTKLLQFWSVTVSAATLIAGIWVGSLLFSSRKEPRRIMLFGLMLGLFPSLILLSARINNDVLATFLAFLSVGLMLKWWTDRRSIWLWASALAIGLDIITKSTGTLLLPVLLVCILLQRKTPLRMRFLDAGKALLLVLLCVGWLYAVRPPFSDGNVVGNVSNLNGALRVENSAASLLTFNPVEIMRHPYNDSWKDSERRQYFPEFLFRSAFFGEFSFGDQRVALARWLLAFAMLMLPLMLLGLWISLREGLERFLPLHVLVVSCILGHLAFRLKTPFAPSQDFRHSLILLLPAFYYVIRGRDALSPNLYRLATFCIQILLVLELVWVLELFQFS